MIDISGAPAVTTLITTSWQRDDLPGGRKRFKLYAISIPVFIDSVNGNGSLSIEHQHPRLAGNPMVISESIIEAPNLEVAKMIHAGQAEMLRAQGPEIVQVRG